MNTTMKLALSFFIFMLSIINTVFASEPSQGITIKNAWVRLLPPSQKSTAAYLTIENKTDKEIILQSVGTEAAELAEMHKMDHVDGIMKMQKVENIHIPAQGNVKLEPGGFHLMLISLKKSIQKGESIPLVLNFSGGHNLQIKAIVGEEGPAEKACCLHKH